VLGNCQTIRVGIVCNDKRYIVFVSKLLGQIKNTMFFRIRVGQGWEFSIRVSLLLNDEV